MTPRRLPAVPALLFLALLLAGCGIGGPGGSAAVALAVDESLPDKPITVPLEGSVQPGQEVFIRLELPRAVEADVILVRFELDVGGRSFFEVFDLEHPVIPPWNVAIIPVALITVGDWNIALIVNSRKITDAKLTVRR